MTINMERLEKLMKKYKEDIADGHFYDFAPDVLRYCGSIVMREVEKTLEPFISYYRDRYIIIADVVLSIDKMELVRYSPEKTEASYVVPEFVETVCDGAFQGSEYLKKVTLSKNIHHIGSRAFSDSSSLSEIVWDTPEATGGSYVFENCPSLKTVIADDAQKLLNYKHDNYGSPFINGAQLIVNGKVCDISNVEKV